MNGYVTDAMRIGEENIGDRDEAHERRADDAVEADPQVGDDRGVATSGRYAHRRDPRDPTG